jgi:protein-tyrosine-phosphatase
MEKVLFVCAENAARSQMAEAFFNHLARRWRAESAGTLPGKGVNPKAAQVMAEQGIDISGARSKGLELSRLDEFQRIISFGCIAKSAFPARDRLEEWLLGDPAGGDLETMRAARDAIRGKVEELVRELEGEADAGPGYRGS